MLIDAFEVRTCDKVKGSAVPDGYVHVVITGVVKADDAVQLADAASEPVQLTVECVEVSELADAVVTKISGERAMLRSKGRL